MNDLSCEQVVERLNAAMCGESLSDSVQETVNEHLDSCQRCARTARQMSSVHRLLLEQRAGELHLAAIHPESSQPPDRLKSRAARRRIPSPRSIRERPGRMASLLIGAAAVLVLVVSAYMAFSREARPRPMHEQLVRDRAESAESVVRIKKRRDQEAPPAPDVAKEKQPAEAKRPAAPQESPAKPERSAWTAPKQTVQAPRDATGQLSPENAASKRESPSSQGTVESGRHETERPIARIAWRTGSVTYSRAAGGRAADAALGIQLHSGDRLETKSGAAVLRIDADSQICVGPHTQVRIHTRAADGRPGILADLAKGDLYIDDSGDSVFVTTIDGNFTPVGTRFGVKRTFSATILVVEEGMVEAQSKGNRSEIIRVKPGYRTRVRKDQPPSKPTRARLQRAMTWTAGFRPERVHREAFEEAGKGRLLPVNWLSLNRPDLQFEILADDPHEGKRSLRVTDRSIEKQGKIWLEIRGALRSRMLGKRIRVRVWLKAVGKPAEMGYLGIQAVDKDLKSKRITVEPEWKRYEFQSQIPEQAREPITVYVCATGTEFMGTVLVDDFSIEILKP